MTLTHGVTTVTLPDPQLGDTEAHNSNAIIRETKGLNPVTLNQWPINIVKNLSLKCMNTTEKNNLISFLETYAGEEIYLSYNGETWLGIIITTIPEIVTTRSCSHDCQFEFLGTQV